MFAARRVASVLGRRTFTTSKVARGGDHHDHKMFSGEAYPKGLVWTFTFGSLIGGTGIICAIAYFQNVKQGYVKN